ncbi:hypothetical protein HYS30_02735, partial [Candidatus Peregrinibacteria bacterium]|nr:hypothetical protein [Candidatus Peregrinibacteria bacterium]
MVDADDRTTPAWRAGAVERMEGRFRNGKFEDACIVGKDLLPLLSASEQSLRMKVYLLLSRCPQDMSERQVRDAVSEAGAVIGAPRGAHDVVDTVRAHLLIALLHAPYSARHPEDAPPLPLQREQLEFQAIHAGTRILGNGNASRVDRMDAHVLLSLCFLDVEDVAPHIEAVLLDGDEAAITRVCCSGSLHFHCATEAQYLERALACVQHPLRRVALLQTMMDAIAWMAVLRDNWKERMEIAERWWERLTDAFAEIALTEHGGRASAFGHLSLAYYYAALDNSFAAFDHVAIVEAMARKQGDASLQKAAAAARESVESILE